MSENRFDERAATWDDDPAHVERAEVVARALRETLSLDRSVRMLEYGAGTGLVSHALRDTVGSITMADTSAGMRKAMNDKIAAGVFDDAHVWDVDLAAGAVPAPDAAQQFDLVVTVMTLHHIADLDVVLTNFATLLAADGHLAVVDLDEEDGSFHHDGFDGHHGFDHGVLTSALERAGFTDVTFRPCHHVVRDGHTYPMFLATAARPTR